MCSSDLRERQKDRERERGRKTERLTTLQSLPAVAMFALFTFFALSRILQRAVSKHLLTPKHQAHWRQREAFHLETTSRERLHTWHSLSFRDGHWGRKKKRRDIEREIKTTQSKYVGLEPTPLSLAFLPPNTQVLQLCSQYRSVQQHYANNVTIRWMCIQSFWWCEFLATPSTLFLWLATLL